MKKTLVLLAVPLLLSLGGCLSKSDASLDASSSSQGSRAKRDADDDKPARREVCEHTEIGGEPKSFCY